MSPATITLAGARGGHGTTTVATALAILAAEHGPTRLVSADATALLGLPDMAGPHIPVPVTDHLTLALPGSPDRMAVEITVVDAGPLGSADNPDDGPSWSCGVRVTSASASSSPGRDLHRPGSS